MQILILFFIIFLFLSINKFNKLYLGSNYKLINPLSIITIEWSAVLFMHYFEYDIQRYTINSYIVVVTGTIFYAIGFWLTAKSNLRFKQSRKNKYGYNCSVLNKHLCVFTIISIMRFLVYLYIVYKLSGSLDTFFYQNTLVRGRYLARPNTIFTYIVELPLSILSMVGYVILGINIVKNPQGIWKIVIIWCILEILVALITMSKLNLFIFIFVITYTVLNNIETVRIQKKIIKKILPVIGILLFIFLITIALQRNYQYTSSIYDATFRSICHYFTCAYEAFGLFLDAYASNSNNVMHMVYVGGGSPTNVFTWYRTFISYLSYPGIAILPLFLGILSGLFYDLPKRNIAIECANAWIGCMLVFSFYSFLWTHNSYLFSIIAGYIIDILFTKNMYLKVKNNNNMFSACPICRK